VPAMSEDQVTVNISKDLYELIKCRVNENSAEFKSVEDYINFVLREIIKEEEENTEQKNCNDEEQIKKRLKNLGYF
jgi:Arc/MetJ-type ribon-helix-helix transcriptional regulator